MSGHNKWSSIKHRKGAQDARRGKVFTKLIKEITISARSGGGDPNANSRLRRALDAAREANMPADNVTRAVKKGTGEIEGVMYEELLYEGVGPAGSLVLMEVTTDNRNRTASEIRKVFDKHNGALGASGSAAWAFENKGVVRIEAEKSTEEQLFDVAVGAGAEDIANDGAQWVVTTPRDALDAVKAALDGAKIPVTGAALEWLAKTPKDLAGRDAEVLVRLLEALDDHDDVQNAYCDASPSDEALAAIGTA
jgi:YebC/PmpR family DNA-binding regulatory protein